MDGRRKLNDELVVGLGAEVPPTSFSWMFLKDKKRLKKRQPPRNMEDIIKNYKRAKDLDRIWSEMCRDKLVNIKNIAKKWMKKKIEPRSKKFFIDSNATFSVENYLTIRA